MTFTSKLDFFIGMTENKLSIVRSLPFWLRDVSPTNSVVRNDERNQMGFAYLMLKTCI